MNPEAVNRKLLWILTFAAKFSHQSPSPIVVVGQIIGVKLSEYAEKEQRSERARLPVYEQSSAQLDKLTEVSD
ncbi:hypothetical protein KIN20_032445 [Parelaphostrongylus tenuis]|uniref:Uncharacterized protein n=1 Tax=Parelaphostrongylus tenuis TaxID=148309 RepID=A0AAD5R6Q0_PARTN|nr:hypothetical protein KIN20_032445 [Parelaphostrongylus tenuis]